MGREQGAVIAGIMSHYQTRCRWGGTGGLSRPDSRCMRKHCVILRNLLQLQGHHSQGTVIIRFKCFIQTGISHVVVESSAYCERQ